MNDKIYEIESIMFEDIGTGHDNGYNVGSNGCIAITEHEPGGGQERHWHDVYFNNGDVLRLFNAGQVLYKTIKHE